jgi:hypothetical protein
VVWVIHSYRTASGAIASRILGFGATGTATTALVSIPATQRGHPQALTIGGGTLFNKLHMSARLVGYRVPGA